MYGGLAAQFVLRAQASANVYRMMLSRQGVVRHPRLEPDVQQAVKVARSAPSSLKGDTKGMTVTQAVSGLLKPRTMWAQGSDKADLG